MSRFRVGLATLFVLLVASCSSRNYQKWQSSQVIDAFHAAGLEAEGVRPLEPADYGAAPLVADEGVRFLIPSLGEDRGGRVFNFDTPEELAAMKAYYETLGESNALFFSWVFTRDNILVQITGGLDEAIARQYEAALNNME